MWIGLAPTAFSQSLLGSDPEFTFIYKVNDLCPDTVRVTCGPSNISFYFLSQTPCEVNLGFGSVFYRRSCIFILRNATLSIMFYATHHDDMLRLDTQEQQNMNNSYGSYRATVRSQEMVADSLAVYNIRFKPNSTPFGTVDMRYSPVLGIISIKSMDREGKIVGKVVLAKINDMSLNQFVKTQGRNGK